MWLRQPEVARTVVTGIEKGVELGHYDLHAYVVMGNHVHLLITPRIDPGVLMKSLKGASAREANRLLGRTGSPFWQKESYDHWVRNGPEFESRTRSRLVWLQVRSCIHGRAQASRRVSTPHARVRAPRR